MEVSNLPQAVSRESTAKTGEPGSKLLQRGLHRGGFLAVAKRLYYLDQQSM